MKTPVDSINSEIITPARNTATNTDTKADARPPRAHIVARRAERWARRAVH